MNNTDMVLLSQWVDDTVSILENGDHDVRRALRALQEIIRDGFYKHPFVLVYCSQNGDELYTYATIDEATAKVIEIVTTDKFEEIVESVTFINLNDNTAFHVNPDSYRNGLNG